MATAPERFCSGTIINSNHILTAAQCVHNDTYHLINPAEFRIIAGDLNIMVPSYRRFTTSASHIYTHPSYTINPRTNDLAVIRVRKRMELSISDKTVHCIFFKTSTSFPANHNTIDWSFRTTRVLPNALVCRFVGWGAAVNISIKLKLLKQNKFSYFKQTATGLLNPVQQRIDAPILDRNACNAADVHRGLVLDNMICAGSLTTTPSLCTGNAGGGLFCQANNFWQLTGVLSFGIGCGVQNIPGVYTQVRFFETWINQQLTRTEATPAGTLVYA